MQEPCETNPKPSPQWVKQTLCEDLADNMREHGDLPDTRAIESIVNEDIRRWQAAGRERIEKREVARAAAKAPKVAEELGKEFYKRPIPQEHEEPKQCACGKCALCKMRMRVFALCQTDPAYDPKLMKYLYPAYGRDIIGETMDCELGRRGYRGLGAADSVRLFRRRIEDICDRSTCEIGLGQWR